MAMIDRGWEKKNIIRTRKKLATIATIENSIRYILNRNAPITQWTSIWRMTKNRGESRTFSQIMYVLHGITNRYKMLKTMPKNG